MKTHTSMTLDHELIQIAKARGINVSGICNNFLRQYLEMTDLGDDKQKEKEELNEKMLRAEAEAAKYREKLWEINTKEQKKQSKRKTYTIEEEIIKKRK